MAQKMFWLDDDDQKFLWPSMTQRRISKELLIYANINSGVKLVKNKKLYWVDLLLAVQWEPVVSIQ